MLLSVHPSQRAGATDGRLAHPADIPGHTTSRSTERPREHSDFFDCGQVRSKSSSSSVDVYTVHSTIQLEERIIPFFRRYRLRVKGDDFETFAQIVTAVRARSHHNRDFFEDVVRLAYSMNARGKQRKRPIEEILMGSSETAREASHSVAKIQSDPHGDMGSQAEMTWPLTQNVRSNNNA